MTNKFTMSDSFGLPLPSRASGRWGHFAPQSLSVCIVAAIVLGLQLRSASLLTVLAAVGLVAFVLCTWVAMRQHDRRLCEHCVASMPLNPMQQAAGLRRRFWLAHNAGNPKIIGPYLVALVGSNFLTSTPGRIVWAAAQASMIYLILANASHRRLQPWCPWCSGGGGGSEHDTAHEPSGPTGNSRVLV